MKVFLDTNIILDFIEKRGDFTINAANIFQLGKDKKIELYVTDLTMVNIAYILRKKTDTNKIYTILSTLRKFVSVIEIGDIVIDKAISLHSKDFEDSVQYYAAERANMDCIITRNTQDFLQGAIPIYQPHDFLDKFIN